MARPGKAQLVALSGKAKTQHGLWLAAASGKQRQDKGKWGMARQKIHEIRVPWAQATHMNGRLWDWKEFTCPWPKAERNHWPSPRGCQEITAWGKKNPVCTRNGPHTQGETDNPVSIQDFTTAIRKNRQGVLNTLKPRCISGKCKICKQWQIKEQCGLDWGLAQLCAELGAPGSLRVTPACWHQAGRSCATGALGTLCSQLCHHSATGFACLAASRRVRISFHCTNCLDRSRVCT